MFSKEEAKEKVAKLIQEFNNHPRKEKLSEEETREFISELFKILGWDFKSGEVTQEEKISKGYVDYGFRLNNVPVLFVEAKRVSAELQDEKFVNQAVDYAWHKATTWAVLINFKRIRIFNSYIRESIRASQLRDLEIQEYIDQFDSLWLLSKQSFENKLIDQTAEKEGKKAKEKPVEKQLFEDLNNWREILAKEIKKEHSAKYSTEEIDEMIQLFLDRLILIRKIEDEGLESKKLEEIYNTWKSTSNTSLWKLLQKLFTEFDQDYNSKIFSPHELDKIHIGDYSLKQILPQLYESEDHTVRYNFSFIDADILGNIYEQYLGYLLKTTAKRAKGKKNHAKRKEQGIYYTPRYIVDYIVKNTLGEKLKECKTIEEVQKIKVLDPACGSGSFLIRAFDEIYSYYKEKGWQEKVFLDAESQKVFETVKDQIIKNNLFGVDLDSKAVEIAQLNLLLKTTDKKHKLPKLQQNIKNGNSLIDDPNVSEKAFNWNKEFENIMKNGGFDVIIGNPPYINNRNLKETEKKNFEKRYKTAYQQYDIYVLFYELALQLLKVGGYVGFITPNKFAITNYGKPLRKLLLSNKIVKISDVSQLNVFGDASTYPYVVVLKKEQPAENVTAIYFPASANLDNANHTMLKQETLKADEPFIFSEKNEEREILQKVSGESLIDIFRAKPTSRNITEMGNSLAITNREIEKYCLLPTKKRINANKSWEIKTPAILMKKICFVPTATILQTNGGIPINTVYVIHPKNKMVKPEYLLAVLNSSLIGYYSRKKYATTAMRGGFIELRTFEIESIPIKRISESAQEPIVHLVKKILLVNDLPLKRQASL